MKIQEVIDEVNEAWGEEHEEKRKKIFWDNIYRKPKNLFVIISLMYIFFSVIFLFMAFRAPIELKEISFSFLEFVFNIPYYLFDVRVGIIVSLASVLLSLYVSVGKFADGIEGVSGDARRAAYRQFARCVSSIIFVVFILNFWHGLLAGFLQGSSFFFGISGPDWGRNIVPEHINLSRYGETPLWVLIFFAWFTYSSCRMLTFHEKYIFIRNALVLQRMRDLPRASTIKSCGLYQLVMRYIDGCNNIPRIGSKKVRLPENYVDRFVDSSDYQGFKFILPSGSYRDSRFFRKNLVYCISVAVTWIALPLVLKLLGLTVSENVLSLYLTCLLSIILLSFFEFFEAHLEDGYFYRIVYEVNTENIGSKNRKIGEWLSFYGADVIVGYIVRIFSFFLVVLLVVFSLVIYFNGSPQEEGWLIPSLVLVLFIISLGLVYFTFWRVRLSRKITFYEQIIIHSEKYLPKYIKYSKVMDLEDEGRSESSSEKQECGTKKSPSIQEAYKEIKGKGEFYLIMAYLYCTMIKVNNYYSEYKDEVGHANIEIAD
ncbi:hypothetical protein [Rothia mucilaginosa]|uniref:hypothetical protein n=1 Tax=Rothia mucilaginosa TaxID=43675 RepID=UPI0028E662C5|nr:hypothetical protein [Rothia mucilaginosa]